MRASSSRSSTAASTSACTWSWSEGVNIAQVTANLQEQVRYQVEGVGGVPVGDINVRVEDLQD